MPLRLAPFSTTTHAEEEVNVKSGAIHAMVKAFLQRGLPIRGVGFTEAHRKPAD